MALKESQMKQADLNTLVETFNEWQEYCTQMWKYKTSLEDDVARSKKQLATSKENGKILQQELDDTKEIINGLQKTLTKHRDEADKVRELQQQIAQNEEDTKKIHKEYDKQLNEEIRSRAEHEASLKAEFVEIKETLKQESSKELKQLREIIEDKENSIKELTEEISRLQSTQQAELLKISQEHSRQIMKLQREASKVQKANQMSTASQDIFRKKLQHTKAESEKEVASLKHTISDLKQKLAQYESQNSQTTVIPSGIKRRRY